MTKSFLINIIFAIALTGLVSCASMHEGHHGKGKPVSNIQFSGAVMVTETPDGTEFSIYNNAKDATARGLPPKAIDGVFARFAAGDCTCVVGGDGGPNQNKFWCEQGICRNPSKCNIYSAKNDDDFSDERQETPGDDGKVWYLPGRLYWCVCE